MQSCIKRLDMESKADSKTYPDNSENIPWFEMIYCLFEKNY